MERVRGFSNEFDIAGPIECRVCSLFTGELTAKHLLSSSNWEFFYCFNCKNWFKVSEKDQSIAYLIKDRELTMALDCFTQSSEMFQPIKKKRNTIGRLFARITFAIYDLISPYTNES
jgi:hypothetical protein